MLKGCMFCVEVHVFGRSALVGWSVHFCWCVHCVRCVALVLLVCCICVVGRVALVLLECCTCVGVVLHLCWCGVALVLVWCSPCVGGCMLCWLVQLLSSPAAAATPAGRILGWRATAGVFLRLFWRLVSFVHHLRFCGDFSGSTWSWFYLHPQT